MGKARREWWEVCQTQAETWHLIKEGAVRSPGKQNHLSGWWWLVLQSRPSESAASLTCLTAVGKMRVGEGKGRWKLRLGTSKPLPDLSSTHAC